MSTIINRNSFSQKLLAFSAQAWYASAAIGLGAFLVYVIGNYGADILSPSNAADKSSFIPNDTVGNIFLATHLSLAMLVISVGMLQLVPALRASFPAFHRWNGRLFLVSAMACSLAGQYLIFTRDIPGNLIMDLGTSSAGILVLVFSALTYKTARARKFQQHRKWAIRLFMVANAGWFFRIGLMLWLAINQGPVGMDMKTFTGPALIFISYAQFLLPLAVVQLYFYAQSLNNNAVKISVGLLILVLTIATFAGVAAASMMMWFPRILG